MILCDEYNMNLELQCAKLIGLPRYQEHRSFCWFILHSDLVVLSLSNFDYFFFIDFVYMIWKKRKSVLFATLIVRLPISYSGIVPLYVLFWYIEFLNYFDSNFASWEYRHYKLDYSKLESLFSIVHRKHYYHPEKIWVQKNNLIFQSKNLTVLEAVNHIRWYLHDL